MNLSQNQFAEKLGINPSNISRWENRKNGISLELAYSIAEKLKIPIELLVSSNFNINEAMSLKSIIISNLDKMSEAEQEKLAKMIEIIRK